jgi:hypothetical protein
LTKCTIGEERDCFNFYVNGHLKKKSLICEFPFIGGDDEIRAHLVPRCLLSSKHQMNEKWKEG